MCIARSRYVCATAGAAQFLDDHNPRQPILRDQLHQRTLTERLPAELAQLIIARCFRESS